MIDNYNCVLQNAERSLIYEISSTYKDNKEGTINCSLSWTYSRLKVGYVTLAGSDPKIPNRMLTY